ncbi:DUF2793 domain-containing protein [Martelella sp. HB161492]|uniref:DUF2793 domain-containing protein n=1 Tax=Martelella sp. HB161492 TaxID=2720726 RepID=UPI0015906D6A|nr:DUF2793 domain-containing protein [Martelella sp. HB161492]
MSENTANLGLPFIMPAQAQKHVTHNEALQRLDAVTQLSIVSTRTVPPPAPAEGERYCVGTGASDAFSGSDNKIAVYQDGSWTFIAPAPGWLAWFEDDESLLCYDGTAWRQPPLPASAVCDMLGVNASADSTNRLTVAGAATLLNNAGNGHQLKINKAASTDTASLLFQTSWSGRAEMGLAGSDNFAIKSSADGSSWYEALLVSDNGTISMPQRPVVRAAPSSSAGVIPEGSETGVDTLHLHQAGFALASACAGGGYALHVAVTGYYHLSLLVTASASAAHSVELRRNSSETIFTLMGASSGGISASRAGSAIAYLSAGDTLTLLHHGGATYELGYGKTEISAFRL